MKKILGLDLGTNSIGWAVVEKDGDEFSLKEKGVRIFQEGVKLEKGMESSKAAERTGYRSARRLKFRRKLRKIETLKVLSEYGFCPKITTEELNDWRYKKVYPVNIILRNWLLTDTDGTKAERQKQRKNPYYFRNLAVTEHLDLTKEEDRFKLGRAFYHIAQRRGFLSNRLEGTKESDGAVKRSIEEISQEKGDKTLGQFFYEKYTNGEKIRDQYTHREAHYLDEFDRICEHQNLDEEFKNKMFKAIFFQRPLKSQKGLIGKCVFENNKQRCSVSHPSFEEYRMLCFINNIKIQTPKDDKLRPLSAEEKEKIIPQFYRKSKENFDFEDIAKQLAPKKQYKYFKDKDVFPEYFLFNYSMKTTVSGSPVSARLKELFGDDFIEAEFEYIREKDGKQSAIDINDIWHVLYTFDNDKHLKEFAQKRLGLDDERIAKFLAIHPKHDYASLSLKAINNILPYLRQGLIYPHAVFLANMEKLIPEPIWQKEENRSIIREEIFTIIQTQNEEKQIIDVVNGMIKNSIEEGASWSEEAEEYYEKTLAEQIKKQIGENKFASYPEDRKKRIEVDTFHLFKTQMKKNMGRGEFAKPQRIDERVKDFISDNFNVTDEMLGKLYHPSATEVYKPAMRREDGSLLLGSPMLSSVRNPMAMRALHQLRKVVNELLKEGIINTSTTIHIEMARDLKDANERKALQQWQREREKVRAGYAERIKEYFKESGSNAEPTNDDILKYQLWEEQNHKCFYTGQEIAISDFLGTNPKYDIEHTIPRSQSFDDSQENKTLCENKFNRSVKKNKIPSELENHAEILSRIEQWKERAEDLGKRVEIEKGKSKSAGDKNAKDNAIQRKHRLSYERDYWKKKYSRFTMQDVPDGFKNSQLVDTGIITKYSRLYLKTVFNSVYTVKGNIVADFRKHWGLQNEYEKKTRVNHIHHCIDAITIACITRDKYDKIAHAWALEEKGQLDEARNEMKRSKPWVTFTEDVKTIENDILISHYTPDVLPKQSKRKLRKRGKIQYTKGGKPIYQKGDTARRSLHKETFYGAIEREITNKDGEHEKQIKYVVRKSLDLIDDNNLKNIVDDRVREIVTNARAEEKKIQKELDSLKKKLDKANEEDEGLIRVAMQELTAEIKNLYMMPNKKGAPIPIKKARVYQPTITNPLKIKEHRDKSLKHRKEYKEYYNVANDSNYLMAIYEGKDANGKVMRGFEIVNNLEAAEYFKYSVQKDLSAQGFEKYEELVPKIKTNGKIEMPIKSILKIGTMVIFWEKNPEEVWEIETAEIKKRLYKVIGLSNQRIKSGAKIYEFATIALRFHQEAMPSSELKVLDGAFEIGEDYKAQRKVNHNQFNALVEGFDFRLNPLGEILKL